MDEAFWINHQVALAFLFAALAVVIAMTLSNVATILDRRRAKRRGRKLRFVVETENGLQFRFDYRVLHQYFCSMRRARRYAKDFVRRHPYGLATIHVTTTHFKWKTRNGI